MSVLKNMAAPPSGTPLSKEVVEDKPPVPNIDSSELYTVDKATETVAGQLEQYSDFNTPLMKRYAQQGQEKASQRGLTNSSIAAGSGMAKVLDKAGEFATTDAGIYNARKNENMRTATQRYTTDETVKSNKYSSDKQFEGTQYSSDSSAEASKYSSDKQLQGQVYASDQQLAGSRVQAAATVQAAASRSRAQIEAAGINATSNELIQASRAEVDLANIKTTALTATLDRESKFALEGVRAANERAKEGRGAYNNAMQSAGNGFSAGVANIDITASLASQQEQFNKLHKVYKQETEVAELLRF